MEVLKYNEILRESIYINKLQNGLNCYIIPRKEYVEKQAIICTNYGSVDNKFEVDKKYIEVPDGIAHFLEHKLFEDEHKCVFDEFVKLGANVNAFTNFTNTAYYFNCTDKFNENLKLLLDFVETPYFTDENVEKEKGIIEQEINMYLDSPFLKVYLNMQDSMYDVCPVKKNIAGSVETIKKINKEMLYLCYDSFYYPENMALICVGDFDREGIYGIADGFLKAKGNKKVVRDYGQEPLEIRQKYVKENVSVSRPIFNMGFKDRNVKKMHGDKIVATKILMDILAGQSSRFYNNLYEKGIVDGPFSMEFLNSDFYGSAVFSGMGEEPEKISIMILEEIRRLKKEGISSDRFVQIKNKHIGRLIRNFNNIDYIASTQVDLFSKNIDLFDIMDSYNKVDISHVEERLLELFNDDNYVLSVVMA